MEETSVNSEPDTGPCGRCEHCRCGERKAATVEIETALRAVPSAVAPTSITAKPAEGGAESRLYPTIGADA